MNERQIIHKLILDIEEKERSYQKELQKIKAEKELLAYIKGMLDITENNVVNFPYYNPNEEETKEAEEDFNVMLKYTLKDDNIISSFKSEIKNLYFLEKIGYRHAEQYQETINHLEEYRNKIKNAYQELVSNETLKKLDTFIQVSVLGSLSPLSYCPTALSVLLIIFAISDCNRPLSNLNCFSLFIISILSDGIIL